MKRLQILFYLLFFGASLYLILGQALLPAEDSYDLGQASLFNVQWERVYPDGRREAVEVPGKCEAEKGEVVRIETKLPKLLPDVSYLCFRGSQQDVTVYIGNTLRKRYSTDGTRLFGKDSASAFVFVQLSPEDAGMTLAVETESQSFYTGRLNRVYFGDKTDIWGMIMQENGAVLLVALCLFLLSSAAIIVSAAVRVFYKTKISLGILGWCTMLASLWVIAESRLRQLLFPNNSVIASMSYIALMLVPFPFTIYINNLQKRRYERMYFGFLMLVALNDFVCILLQVLEKVDFVESMAAMIAMIVVMVLIALITILIDWREKMLEEYRLVAIGCIGIVFSGILTIYCMNVFDGDNYIGLPLCAGLSFLLIMASIAAARFVVDAEKEKQKALEASASKVSFLTRMSHEIRTPINTILGMNEMILRENKDIAITEYVNYSQKAGRMLLSLVNDVLDFSKIDSGVLHIADNPYSLTEILSDSYHMLEARAKKKDLTVELNVDKRTPNQLSGDEVAIKQILTNLLTNAVKYTSKGCITLGVSGMYADNGEFSLKITVADTGDGIREEDIGKLYESFSRLDEKKNQNIEGSGLGLPIVKQLVDKMEGEIKVQSVYGKGSLFTVVLPQRVVGTAFVGDIREAFRKEAEERVRFRGGFVAPQAKILAVDDNDMNLMVIQGLLKQTQMQIDTASGGEEALELCASKRYDLIFMDHMMPGMDGVETMKALHKEKKGINYTTPVVVLTANAVAGCKDLYLKEGFVDYISKPVDVMKLDRILRTYLEPSLIIEGVETEKDKMEGLNPEVISAPKTEVMEKMPAEEKLHHIDRAIGLQYCLDDDLYRQVLESYLEQGQEYKEQLPSYYETKAWHDYAVVSHAIKSSSLSIGAVTLSDLAKEQEFLGKDENEEEITKTYDAFYKEFCETLVEIEGMLKQ